MNEHIKTHLDERNVFKCTEEGCEHTYTKKAALKKHIETFHLGLKKHQCDVCKKTFAHKHTLTKHAVTHQPGYVKQPVKPRKTWKVKKQALGEADSIIYKITGIVVL